MDTALHVISRNAPLGENELSRCKRRSLEVRMRLRSRRRETGGEGLQGQFFPRCHHQPASVKARPLRHSNHSNINSVRSYLRLEKRHFGTGNLTFLAARRSLRSKLDYVCIIPFNCTTHDTRHTTHARQERSQSERAKGRGAKEGEGGSTRGTTRRPRHLPRRSPATGAHRATARRARPARPRRRARAGS